MDDKVTAAEEADLGPSSGEVLGAEFQKRRRRLFFAVVGGLAILGGGIAAFVVYSQHKAKAQTEQSFSELSMCLFGEAGPGDRPSIRFRQSQLGAMGLVEKDRGKVDGVAWPQRCGPIAQDLLERAKDAGLTSSGAKDLGYWADQLAKRVKAQDGHLADTSESIDATFAEAGKVGLVVRPAPKLQGPPDIANPRALGELKGSTLTAQAFPLKEIGLEKNAGEEQFVLVQDATVSPPVFLCNFKADGIECGKLPENLTKAGHGLRLLGTTEKGASPLIFEGNRGDAGVYRSDTGEKIDALFAYGGYASKAGGAFVLGWDETKFEAFIVSRERGAPKPKRETVKADFQLMAEFFTPQLLWNMVVAPGSPKVPDTEIDPGDEPAPPPSTKDDDKKKKKKIDPGIFMFPIDEKSGAAGEPRSIFPLRYLNGGDSEESHIVGCRSDKATAVFAWGASDGDLITFNIDGQWTKPLSGFFRGALTCDGASVALTAITQGQSPWDGGISETRCTSAECRNAFVELKKIIPGGLELAPRKNLIDVTEIDEKLVVAWAAGDRGGVRVRVGSSHDVETTKDIVAFDDLALEGVVGGTSVLEDLRLLHAPGHAVLLLGTTAGVVALRIEPSGAIAPEKVTWK